VDDDIEDIWADVRAPARPKRYQGQRLQTDGKCHVIVSYHDNKSKILPLCLNVAKHSPTGFEWGYDGSGPAQLALAILCDHFGHGKIANERALRLHQLFKVKCVAKFPHTSWTMDGNVVEKHVQDIESQLGDQAPTEEKAP
jgi:hypothetical protein